MSDPTLSMDLRRVLDAPPGHRFSHTPHRTGTRPGSRPTPRPASHPSTSTRTEPLRPLVSLGRTPRERELLAQMPDTPGLRRRLERGDLPDWMRIAAARRTEEPDRPQKLPWWHDQIPDPTPQPAPKPTPKPAPTPVPEPSRSPDQDTEPARPLPIPHPRREQVPRPPLPRRSDRPRRPAAHRKPRHRIAPLVASYALAALTGAMAQPLLTLLT